MRKAELVATIAAKTGNTRKDTITFLNAFTATIGEVLTRQDKISLVEFGCFETVKWNARIRRNPQNGKMIHCAEKAVPVFRPAKKLKAMVNKGSKKQRGLP